MYFSQENGYEGRVALHATDEAIGFYRKLGNDLGVDLFYPQVVGVSGYHPGTAEQAFLEMQPQGATAFLEAFRHE